MGLPWLLRENPDINWKKGTLDWRVPDTLTLESITESNYSSSNDKSYELTNSVAKYCINSIHTKPNMVIAKAKISEQIEQRYGNDSKKGLTEEELIPPLYHKYLDRFSKKLASRFLKPRIWDHEINLIPGFKPQQKLPIPFNQQEAKIAQEFIKENLEKGYIVKSKSPMASPLFFVGKKDGTARPCQDYRKLNDGTIKDAFPLPNIQDLLRDL